MTVTGRLSAAVTGRWVITMPPSLAGPHPGSRRSFTWGSSGEDVVHPALKRVGVFAETGRGSYESKYLIFDPASYEFLGFRDERISASGKKKYTQLSHVVDWGIVDRVKQRP
ncbi:hypothetical protein ACP4I1_18530 [Streptomyces sp. WG4]|uniref:hypothetical protein n=1 Tax=Streptomyces sp. WG4 TaxID=3417649 RepID=UPI003CEEB900